MKIKYIYPVLLLFVISFLLIAAFKNGDAAGEETRNDKIIKFSHKVHSESADCQSCHVKVLESISLKDRLFPGHEECSQCHDVEDQENCTTCHYDENYEPLIKSKTELIFNHKSHLTQQNLNCQDCHKGISEVEYSFQSVQPNPPMAACASCHNDERGIASNACESCHISTADLIPQSHQQNDFKLTHKFEAIERDADCMMCHDNSSCEDCHVGTTMLTEKNTSDDFYAPYSPHNFVDGAKQQKITRVHDLNYVYTHGIDLKAKDSNCQTCHQVETFCSACHNSEGGDFASAGFVPASHKQPGFITIGVGSGGGDHSVLAKRDIERCAACHDTQGADPNCITCHLDSDGIKGTNPKTHPNNFMRDEKGDWHDSQGSLCYNCHTSASPSSPAGLGFCGYCHGSNVD